MVFELLWVWKEDIHIQAKKNLVELSLFNVHENNNNNNNKSVHYFFSNNFK